LVRTAGIILYVVAATFVMALLAIAVSFFSRSGDGVHEVARSWARSILAVSGIRVRLVGREKVDPEGVYVFMANHQSNFDIPVVLAHLPFQFRWIAKAELFRIPIFGRAMRGAGYISIDRKDRAAAFQSLGRAAERMALGKSIMIFPEGTRTRDGRLQAFKKGGFVLAIEAGMPIVPLSIDGTFSIMSKNGLRIRPQDVEMRFGEPISGSAYAVETKEELMQRVRQAILAGMNPRGGD
jgi:1-acyl-sn-glycerol-3-phosphate acyltransferase